MAVHEVVVYANPMPSTQETAPFLGRYQVKSVVSSTKFFTDVASLLGISAERAQLILNDMLEGIETDFQIQAAKYNLKSFAIQPTISGYFTSINDNFDWSRGDEYRLQLYFGKELRDYMLEVTPNIVTESEATKVKINHLQGDGMPVDVIDCYGEAVYQGKHLVMSDDGAGAYLLSKTGTKTRLIVTAGDETQGTCHLFEPVSVGSYTACFMSRGGDSEGPLQTATKVDVRVLAGTAPTPSSDMPTFLSGSIDCRESLADVFIDTEKAGWPENLARVEFEANNGRTGHVTADNLGAGQIQLTTDTLWTGSQKLVKGDKIKIWALKDGKKSNTLIMTVAGA